VKRLIIDSDMGCDDACALMLALHADSRHEAKVECITTVFGNVSCEQATKNTGALLALLGRADIPFYQGAQKPLLGALPVCGWPGHGTDGLGDSGLTCPADVVAQQTHAAVQLVEMVRAHPQTYDIIALGPLTNLALAIALEPRFPDLVRGVMVMGGTRSVKWPHVRHPS
jgi:inosine-uridine nucleoside N-ribohydrolase